MSSAVIKPENIVEVIWAGGRSEPITLDATGKSGGAGEIFSIQGKPGFVAKIYHAHTSLEHLERYRRKIQWMIDYQPALPQVPAEYRDIVQLAWPEGLILRQSHFVGFAMRKIAFDRTLELDYLLNRRQSAQEGFDSDYGKLVTVSFNLASIINSLHEKRIAIVDLKPMNVKVYKESLYVSILDCDGFHIDTDEYRSDAPQVTPEYLAPEFQDQSVAYPEAQDRFALATIIFRLLNYGIHPFTGVASDHGNYPPELAGRIKQSLYPYGRIANPRVRKVPASVHEAFPDNLRELFDRAFACSGYSRPSAHEWIDALAIYASKQSGQMSLCSKGHLRFSGRPCPTCMRDALIEGAEVRRRSFLARLQSAPARTLKYVQKTLRHTHSSPFQAALAQAQFAVVQLAPPAKISTRNAIALEILWIAGLLITYWWTK
ncbi:MAG: protein kinase domain-containing protein [Steroidobacteraceae bacterium]